MGYLEQRAGLDGKVAIVIGGAAGVGAAVTRALALSGVHIAFCDINDTATQDLAGELGRLPIESFASVTDALDPDQLARFYEAFDQTFDRLDIVVNVVGGVQKRLFTDTTPAQWSADIHRNLGWVMLSLSLAVPRIRRGGRGGSIINFTTVEAHRGAASYAPYAGAKAGLSNFSRALAVELGTDRIRVNLVAPDTTPTEGGRKAVAENDRGRAGMDSPELMEKAFSVYIPLGAPPPVDSIGDAVLFLASDLSSSTTGTTIHVDGGTWASSGFMNWPEPRGWGPTPSPLLFREDR